MESEPEESCCMDYHPVHRFILPDSERGRMAKNGYLL